MSWTKAFGVWVSLAATFTALFLTGCSGGSGENVEAVSSAVCTGVTLAASPVGSTSIGTPVHLTASGASCGGIPEYRYVQIKNGGSSVQIQDWSTSATATWTTTGSTSGAYSLIVYTRTQGTTAYSTTYLATNYYLGSVCTTTTSFTTNPTPPQSAGVTVALSATATCTSGTPEFRYAYLAPGASAYVYVGAYGVSSWNTATLPAGAYTLIVYTRAVGNTSTYESYRYGSYTLGSTCSAAGITAAPAAPPASPQPIGTQVTVTGTATCTAPQFRYSYRVFGTPTWIVFGTSWVTGSQVWNTTGLSSGNYQLLVEARATGDTGGAETTSVANYALGDTCNAVTLTASPTSPQAAGVSVTLTGAATCVGTGTPEYQFLYRSTSTTTLTTLRTYGAATTTWATTGLTAGNYILEVQTRAVGSSSNYDTFADIGFTLGALAITQISPSLGYHTCARVNDGTARCWGLNDQGQLGAASPAQSTTPLAVSGLTNVTAVATGVSHSLALLGSGTVMAWGANADGQLGNNSTTQSPSPVAASGLSGVTQITAGTAHSCALLSSGAVDCWGNGRYGQIGSGGSTTLPFSSSVPVAVAGLGSASFISGGSFHTCALVGGGVMCWGENSLGQMGGATTAVTTNTPVAIPGLTSGVTALSSGDSHTCAIVAGAVECWGDDTYGQLGDGSANTTHTNTSSAVVTVPGITTATSVAAGFTFTCALLSNKTVKCWGRNVEGELGDGTGVDNLAPTQVSGLSTVTALQSGGLHACAILSGNTADCWGYNANGAVGNSSTNNALSPAAVTFP